MGKRNVPARLQDPDFSVTSPRMSGIMTIALHSDAARAWFDDNGVETERWQWRGNVVAVEPRMGSAIVDAMLSDGLILEYLADE